ncbi:beta-ketoacyl-[acyl-carrier-protein] synthase family protein [Kitasatospora kifunensis]|uniref:3-oxoacyl-[acyl-carrier-protein] synthase II n=1 Tax=Kitasatospora kifunensis TaxID=58351 RepID=A0A7W7R666_KITKI|nr:beta-ketoacyl-[acyl-carrier-protein] synthase family protein [Kitasatospora kifunensis]MBB4926162.1 3-oxoacyl-[acyl-carrier-protein] synthase II [Kitasatospora kifunensis]
MSRPDIAVTGLGMLTPAGIDVAATWRGVCAGGSTAASCDQLAGLPVDFCCKVPAFDVPQALGRRTAHRLDRSTHLALLAAEEALRDAALDPLAWDGTRVGVVIGSGLGASHTWESQCRELRERGPGRISPLLISMIGPSTPASEVALACGAHGPALATATACASGASAVTVARDLLATGQCDVVLAGGTEACTTPLITTGFAQLGALSTRCDDPATASRPFDLTRDGFVLAEAAAVLVLERAEHAAARRHPPRALLAGCGSATDAHHPTAPHPEGRGIKQALRAALADAALSHRDVHYVNAHGTATVQGDAVEAAAISTLLPAGPFVTSTKGALGHSLGAAGAVEAALTVLSLQHSLIPPTANLDTPDPAFDLNLVTKTAAHERVSAALSTSVGFGGHNVVLAFRAP